MEVWGNCGDARSAVRLHVRAGARSERVGGGPKNRHRQTHDAARLHQ